MVLSPSSLISRLPSFATVIPTGRPQTFAVGRDEAGLKIFVFAAFCRSFVERCAHDFVTSAFHAVP
jgi:hypothetical protein